MHGLRERHTDPPAESLRIIRQLYDPLLSTLFDDPRPRLADLDQLVSIAAGYRERTTFLAMLALEPPSSTQDLAGGRRDEEDDALVLSTIHSAKGKEWDAVFVIGAVDGVYPLARVASNDDAVDEERRLLYVAMTRARHHLCITYPLQGYATRTGADFSYAQLSRFLDARVLTTMERVTLEAAREDDPSAPLRLVPTGRDADPTSSSRAPVFDLRAALSSRFGAP
jgi:DNA helicase-2/ATP-dependent DNA helicase PcrA